MGSKTPASAGTDRGRGRLDWSRQVQSICLFCKLPFEAYRSSHVYCTDKCRDAARQVECLKCGAATTEPRGRRSGREPICQSCSRSRYAARRRGGVTRLEVLALPPDEFVSYIRTLCSVNEVQCWEWTGPTTHEGYPVFHFVGGRRLVHRMVLEAKWGKALGGLHAHHACANRCCVSPDHLQPVTHRENVAEMLARNSLERRISLLEEALRSVAPTHPALDFIPVHP